MVRPAQRLHAFRAPVTPRPAATVLLIRDGANGLEVLMTRRSPTASFAPGAFVFPGGAIDAADAAAHVHARRRATQEDSRLTQAIAAIRESFEELGVLLARRADGRHADAEDVAVLDRRGPFFEQCLARRLVLAADEVFLLTHWITDRDLPKRFDVSFLVARMPEGQHPEADGQEQFEPVWVRPPEALERHRAGQFFMIFPTIRTLERLATYACIEDVLAECAGEQPWFVSCPRGAFVRGQDQRFMEHELPFGELALVCPDGQMLHHLDWQCDKAVPLLRNVARLTCSNPGMMTGPGTNSYLVGDAQTGFIAIDPGPVSPEHQRRLHEAAHGDIRFIVCTHSHPDHSPGARILQEMCDRGGRRPPLLGMASLPTAASHSAFVPDRELADGERIVVGESEHRHTLRAVHTPGHAANHLCFLLEEDRLLFTGDHVLNGTTPVIDPPDGNMTAYLESLDRLIALCEREGVGFLLPAHGHVLGNEPGQVHDAPDAIRRLRAHRLRREAKILSVMRKLPGGTPDDWLPHAYDDVPRKLWPVAMRSLIAHVERIREGEHAVREKNGSDTR
ncbi:MAG: MBL fold metallo-hydrolase [Betaproteobacteria bacterium]|nr:MBL fold metallo-hydrolase [Betaproteobacteria bacterium]